MNDTPRTDAEVFLLFKTGDDEGVTAEFARKLERENAALRNEVARLNNQTNWVCSCGGTDCAGQKENAALRQQLEQWEQSTQWFAEWAEKKQELERENAGLRKDKERLDWLFFAPYYRMGLFRKHLNRLIKQKISSEIRDRDEGNLMYRAAMDAARKET